MTRGIACKHEWLEIGSTLNPDRDYFEPGSVVVDLFICTKCGSPAPLFGNRRGAA
jgi:hypothetical protein